MVLFDDTKVTYADKSDKDLVRAYFLFRIISNPIVVKVLTSLLRLANHLQLPIKGILKATVYKQFCGGTSIAKSEVIIDKLWKSRIKTILNFSAEGKATEADFKCTEKEIIATIKKASNSEKIPFTVFKPTAITSFSLLEKLSKNQVLSRNEEVEKENFDNKIHEICKTAFELEVPIFIDAEESWIQTAIDEKVMEMMQKFNNKKAWIFNTIQLYRNDRLAYLKEVLSEARKNNYFIGLKLVRGAYHEQEIARAESLNYPCPVHRKKADTDKDFNLAQKFCVENIDKISFCSATHNEESSAYLTELIQENNLNKKDKRIIFSQLLGMSDHISYNLAKQGFSVSKYVPYGPVRDVIPYLIRRATENTSIAGQMNRELSNIIKERKRRKNT
ncbi:MAG: proline dehydrogenase family protein [Bacteroidota bacterium]|nr:proline dehydrogenase family protein [Bacteroidota bacterium]